MTGATVRAAGGVVRRTGEDGAVEVLLVHRPAYDDWTLPKGKNEPGEDDEACARREVHEETGLRVRLGEELPSIAYADRYGRPKVVRYWLMEIEAADPWAPGEEIDELAWLPLDAARARLTYDRDREVLDALR